MALRTFALFLICCLLPASAQKAPDFSGVFLRNSVENHITPPILRQFSEICPQNSYCPNGSTIGDLRDHEVYNPQPSVLEIKQTGSILEIVVRKNGESSAARYELHGKSTNQTLNRFPTEDRAELKGSVLHLRSTVHLNPRSSRTFNEEWWLSKDSQNLTIRRKISGVDGSEIEHYDRQSSLEVALEKAAALGPDEVVDPAALASSLIQLRSQYGYPYDTNTPLGAAVYSQFSKSAVFYLNSAKGKDEPAQYQPISQEEHKYFNLEIEVQQIEGTLDGSDERWYPQPALVRLWGDSIPDKLDSEFTGLRFHAKWKGSFIKDLGEIPSELSWRHLGEPWSEIPPKVVYGLQVAAENIPYDGRLEIEVLTNQGKHIALIHAQI
jgi:hypothetical protein